MNAFDTLVNQIETFGVFYHQYKVQDTGILVKLYHIDKSTIGIIEYTPNGKAISAKFILR